MLRVRTSQFPDLPYILSTKPQPHITSIHFHVVLTVAPLAQLWGTVYCLFAPDSYVTAPLLSTLMNLYSKVVPAGKLIVVIHNGFDDV